ncbi:hypothetical protein FOZ63_014753, partial [Perkinsus olseni]
LFFIGASHLAAFHIYLTITGITTYEFIIGRRNRKHQQQQQSSTPPHPSVLSSSSSEPDSSSRRSSSMNRVMPMDDNTGNRDRIVSTGIGVGALPSHDRQQQEEVTGDDISTSQHHHHHHLPRRSSMDLESIAESVGVSVGQVDNPRQPTIQELASIASSSPNSSSHWISYGSNGMHDNTTTTNNQQ